MIFEIGVRTNVTDVSRHRAMKGAVASAGGSWPLLVEFEQAAVHNYDFESYHRTNPFVARQYSFGEASRVVEGRALDEATSSVRIANYMVGPSNCIAKSTYYSVCCLSDFEGLLNELEGKIRAPTATPGRIMAEVRNLTASPDMRLPPDVAEVRLRAVAGHNGGEVPLHGRLFAEFLHYAFPVDCPYPHVSEDVSVLAPSHWTDRKATAPKEERQRHIQGAEVEVALSTGTEWSEEEVLPVQEPAKRSSRGLWSVAVRAAMQLATVLAASRAALAAWRTAVGARSGGKGPDKEKSFVLPLR